MTEKGEAGLVEDHDPQDGKSDYCGIPLDEWKALLAADVEVRFGKTPADLVPVGEAGW